MLFPQCVGMKKAKEAMQQRIKDKKINFSRRVCGILYPLRKKFKCWLPGFLKLVLLKFKIALLTNGRAQCYKSNIINSNKIQKL